MDFNASSFWDVLLWSLFFFVWIAFIVIWVRCVFDLFSDHQVSTIAKVLWTFCFIFFGWVTTLVYLIARGGGMAERHQRSVVEAQERQARYIREAAGSTSKATSSSAQQIANGKELLDAGAITQAEFDALKAKALG